MWSRLAIILIIFALWSSPFLVFGDQIEINGAVPLPTGSPQEGGGFTQCSDLPGIMKNCERADFVSFLKWLFPFMLSVAAFLAVLMIIISGLTMVISAGSEASVKNAQSRFQNAIFGLILAFAAWLILETINPDLVGWLKAQTKPEKRIVLIDKSFNELRIKN